MSGAVKRARPEDLGEDGAAGKRATTDALAVVAADAGSGAGALIVRDTHGAAPARTSSLDAPTMLLQGGHGAAVTGVAFSPDGRHLASCSKDKTVQLWDASGECANYLAIRGHKNAVLAVAWSADGAQLCTASADKTAGCWDAETGARVKTLAGHSRIVNDVAAARRGLPLLVTASDDGAAKVWDARQRAPVLTLPGRFPLLACAFADDGGSVFAAGVEGRIRQFDLRRAGGGGGAVTAQRVAAGGGMADDDEDEAADASSTAVLTLSGHSEAVTSLAVSPDGTQLLSFGMDNALRCWDVRPFVAGAAAGAGGAPLPARCVRVFSGATQNFEQNLIRCCWSQGGSAGGSGAGEYVACGSADRSVYVWDAATGALRYALPGHQGVVTAVAWHPSEPVLASCSTDKRLFLGELADA